MTVTRSSWAAIIAAVILVPATGLSQVPNLLDYEGYLTKKDTAEPQTGVIAMTFRLYDAVDALVACWTEDRTATADKVTVTTGYFTVALGGKATLPDKCDFSKPLWLGVTVEGDANELLPRQELVSVPYAFRAQAAQTVTDVSANKAAIQGYAQEACYVASGPLPVAHGGTGATAQNFVDLTSAQSIAGTKTFTNPIVGSITGNAATVTNGLYSTGSYSSPGWLTSVAGSIVSGDIVGNAGNVTGVVGVAHGGTGASTQNFVDLTTNQTVAGVKTFTSIIGGSITGNAATVTNGVYTNGSYSNPAWLSSVVGSKVSGDIVGNAGNVNGVVGVAHGGTGMNLLTSGGTGQYVQQPTAGGGFTVGPIAAADLPAESGNYIQNQTGVVQNAGFNVGGDSYLRGNVKVGGKILQGAVDRWEETRHDPLGPDYLPNGMNDKNGNTGARSWGVWSNGLGISTGSAEGFIQLFDGKDLSLLPDGHGNVGIGTASPQATLDVQGTANVSGTMTAASLFLSGGGLHGRPLPYGAAVPYYVGTTFDWSFGTVEDTHAGSGRQFLVYGNMYGDASIASYWVWLITVWLDTGINVATLQSVVIGGDPGLGITRPSPGVISFGTNNNGKIKRLSVVELSL